MPTSTLTSSGPIPLNRAMRRRLKRLLKMPFTPSLEFTVKYMEAMADAGAVQRQDDATMQPRRKPTVRAFEDGDKAATFPGSQDAPTE